MSDDPFDDYDYIPALKYLEEGWEVNPRRPPSQVELLWTLVNKHFPEFQTNTRIEKKFGTLTALDWVTDCDDTVRFQCAQLAIFSDDFDFLHADNLPTYQHQNRPAKIFRMMLNAITEQDPTLWRENQRNMDSRIRDLLHQAALQLGRDSTTISDTLNLIIGPVFLDDDRKIEFWARQYAEISLALKNCQGGGRPKSVCQDDAVRALVSLWETLSGRVAVQPSHQAGSSSRSNSMVSFVTEAIGIYSDFGLKGAVSVNSGAFWKRVLS